MHLIDTHCHLDFEVFDDCRQRVVEQAMQVGVRQFVVPSVTRARFQNVLQLANDFPNVYPALGLHPCFISEHQRSDIDILQGLLSHSRVCALGEIGLDAREGMAAMDIQLALFDEQLLLARRFSKPVILHVVKAHDLVLSRLRRIRGQAGGVVHAFSGSEQQAREYAKLGFYLGMGGSLTYSRATKLQGLVQRLPLKWWVLETDSPDMPLQGFQGQPNTPSQVRRVAEKFAELSGVALEEVAEQTNLNARQCFGVDYLL